MIVDTASETKKYSQDVFHEITIKWPDGEINFEIDYQQKSEKNL